MNNRQYNSMRTAASDSGDVFMNLHRPVSGTCSRLLAINNRSIIGPRTT